MDRARVAIDFNSYSFDFEVPLQPFKDAWNSLVERNRRSRERDEFGCEARWQVQMSCPKCGANQTKLTSMSVNGALRRACRACGEQFDVG